MMTQYQADLIAYVIANSNIMHAEQAMAWLDEHCPYWKEPK